MLSIDGFVRVYLVPGVTDMRNITTTHDEKKGLFVVSSGFEELLDRRSQQVSLNEAALNFMSGHGG